MEFEKKIAAGLSIFSNALIIILKLIAGVISGSISILSEAIHSISDFFASVLTFFAISRSSEPADKEHPFGHGKYEDVSGFIEGGMIIFAGLYIICEAIKKIILGCEVNFESLFGIYVMGFSVLANIVVSSYLFYVAKKTDSISLYADAQHLRTDIFSSLGVLLALFVIKYSGFYLLDPIIAILVSILIMKTGFSISKETLNNLLDGSLPSEEVEIIEKIICSHRDILDFKNLKTRKSGKNKLLEMTLLFNPEMKILECHRICDEVEGEISMKISNIEIITHLEPKSVE